jgi:hypothetical protein
MRTLTIVLALACTGCGGADTPPAPPNKLHHTVPDGGHRHLLLFRDAAEPEDYAEVADYPYVFSADGYGVIVGSTNPSASAVRLWVSDVLGTPYITDLRTEK